MATTAKSLVDYILPVAFAVAHIPTPISTNADRFRVGWIFTPTIRLASWLVVDALWGG
jgi:hypothetical protein